MTSPWWFWAVAMLLAGLGLALMLWALLSDRARGRRRCPKCWYDMHAAPSLCCPECGHDARHARRLQRTRRHWHWVAVSVIPIMLAGYFAVQPRVRQDGWLSVVPTTALIWMLSTDKREAAMDELGKRWFFTYDYIPTRPRSFGSRDNPRDSMYAWQRRWLQQQCVAILREEPLQSDDILFLSWSMKLATDAVDHDELLDEAFQVIRALLVHHDPRIVGLAMAYSIDERDIAGSIAHILPFREHDDANIRSGVSSTLYRTVKQHRHDLARSRMLDDLSSPHDDIRAQSLIHLWDTTGHHDLPPQELGRIADMRHDPSPDVREHWPHTMILMGALSEEQQTALLLELMDGDDSALRRGAMYSLLVLTHDQQAPLPLAPAYDRAVILALMDDDDRVQRYASAVAGHIPEQRIRDLEADVRSIFNTPSERLSPSVSAVVNRFRQILDGDDGQDR